MNLVGNSAVFSIRASSEMHLDSETRGELLL